MRSERGSDRQALAKVLALSLSEATDKRLRERRMKERFSDPDVLFVQNELTEDGIVHLAAALDVDESVASILAFEDGTPERAARFASAVASVRPARKRIKRKRKTDEPKRKKPNVAHRALPNDVDLPPTLVIACFRDFCEYAKQPTNIK